ncbi:MAG: transglutaminase family protein [bacterium]|nr:transglutaminase family protein [bacterium]
MLPNRFQKLLRSILLKRKASFRIVVSFLVFSLGFLQPISVVAQNTLQVTSSQGILYSEGITPKMIPLVSTRKPGIVSELIVSSTPPSVSPTPAPIAEVGRREGTIPPYSSLMREFRAVQLGKNSNGTTLASDEQSKRKAILRSNLERFLKKERDSQGLLSLFDEKKQTYFAQLETQIQALGGYSGFIDSARKIVDWMFGGRSRDSSVSIIDDGKSNDVLVPEHPATFSFSNDRPVIQGIEYTQAISSPGQVIPSGIKKLIKIDEVSAAEVSSPTLDDVKTDDAEVLIPEEIMSLARDLDSNPVKINNYLAKTLQYEPYWGAKKGSVGCLREKFCNDVDASSLAVALYRAAGIPAHYKKSLILASVDRLKRLLGVNDSKAVIAAFSGAKIPVYVLSNALDGKQLVDADLSNEKYFVLEWVHPEIFIEYDERAGNIQNSLSFEESTSTEDVQKILSVYPQKEWIGTDVIFAPVQHSQGEDVLGLLSFNTRAFFSQYLQGDSTVKPLNALESAVNKLASNRHILTDKNVRSTMVRNDPELPILPPALPYTQVQGAKDGVDILPEVWSRLPDTRKAAVTISLLRTAGKELVLDKTFFGSEINNQETILSYTGATDADKEVITEYGGIAQTPAALVDIVPMLDADMTHVDGLQKVKIGEMLTLRFTYTKNGEVVYTDEKFSVAGNQEGIYISLSRILYDSSLDTNQHILLRGNVGIARVYLENVVADAKTLSEVLDHPSTIDFTRAVVTENRILTQVNNLPTTFDFKGLSIDASAYINDYSARSSYLTNRQDFHLLYGLIGSYYEAATLSAITGLSGISTVSGLQYAYANPDTYSISEIGKTNESAIDALNLSTNTKANMHTEVGKGNTIITPNTLVQKGAWRGVLYIVLTPDGTGQYAIGEQTAGNGGWTIDPFTFEDEVNENGEIIGGHVHAAGIGNNGASDSFIFGDTIIDSVMCRPSNVWREDIKRSSGWKGIYGFPCTEETKEFGLATHTFILASKAAKFTNLGTYDYWITRDRVREILQEDKEKENVDNLVWISLSKTLKFNPIAGTYSWAGSHWFDLHSRNLTAYYQPSSDQRGRGIVVYGSILNKLEANNYKPDGIQCVSGDSYCVQRNWVLHKLGYPLESRKKADMFVQDWMNGLLRTKVGYYQTFAGGQVYIFGQDEYTYGVGNPNTYYVPGQIATVYNSNGLCLTEENGDKHCGSGGVYGFPTADPTLLDDKVTLHQDFEINRAIVVKTNQSSPAAYDYAAKYICAGSDKNSYALTGKAFFHGAYDSGNEIVQGALLFIGLPFVVGTAIDYWAGTHGAVSVAIGATTGYLVASAIYSFSQTNFNDVLVGISDEVSSQVRSAQCTSRQAYLLSRHSPNFVFLALGMKGFAKRGAREIKSLAQTAVFVAAKDKKIVAIKELAARRLMFLELSLKGITNTASISLYREFMNEVLVHTTRKGAALSKDEIQSILSKVYTDKNILQHLGLKKLSTEKNIENTKSPDILFRGAFFPVDSKGYLKLDLGKYAELYQKGDVTMNVVLKDGEWFFTPNTIYIDTVNNGNPVKIQNIHPQLVAGEEVHFAGEMVLKWDTKVKNWKLTKITNRSGHYSPESNTEDRLRLLEYSLERSKINTDSVSVEPWDFKYLDGHGAVHPYKKWEGEPLE